ncbi:hypothetical protein F4781DRAFT_402319 [Annulohypoxylon bovei var. microspora]|nr:hypothetical protein F4781DRAFT_402319 [Annulohypoxylon bovei var. microspora]
MDLSNIPAIPPPDGVTPNFIDPYSLALPGRVVIGVTLPLIVISVASRLYTRIWITRATGADDYLCLAATASVIAYCGATLSILGSPLGPHQWDVPLIKITPKFIQGCIIVADLYSSSAMLLKTSLLVLYLRMFRVDKTANILIWIGIILIVLFYSACIIGTSYLCRQSQWPSNASPTEFLILQSQSGCNHPQLNLAAGQGVFSTVSDLYVLVIPINLIWGLRLPLRRRVGICSIFLVGLLATGCSVATLYSRFHQRNSIDFTYDSALNMILGGMELNVGVICSCMPVGFIMYKRVSTSSWTYIRHFLRTRRSGSGDSTVVGSGGDHKLPGSSDGLQDKLPDVPRATLTGLRTLLRGDRTVKPQGMTEMSTYTELRSVDEEYHAQLKRAWATGSTPSRTLHSEGNASLSIARPTSESQQV